MHHSAQTILVENTASAVATNAVGRTTALGHLAESLFFAAIILILQTLPSLSQTAIPDGASARSYGGGWECDLGYRAEGDVCEAIDIPDNAFKTNRAYGVGWACLHGFTETEASTCIEVIVPDGAFLDPSGERWECLRGFREKQETCQEIKVPKNAYLTDDEYGTGWKCARRFEAVGSNCALIDVPDNAYLNALDYGRPWTCERGFFEKNDLCEAVNIPSNAYFKDAAYGKSWECKRGYAAVNGLCKEIDIPANAHLARSGNRWSCNSYFQRSRGRCVLLN
jgi:hypothetical protein